MADLIGKDGLPLSLMGIALPYGEWIEVREEPESFLPGAFSRQYPDGEWHEGVDLTWEHDETHIVAESHNLSILDTAAGLFFHAVLPDTQSGRHAALCAANGALGASVLFHLNGADDQGAVRSARLKSIGLTFSPAYPTAVWRSDLDPAYLPIEARAVRGRFIVADMMARSRTARPDQPDPASTKTKPPTTAWKSRRPSKKERQNIRIAQENMRRVESGELDRELLEMNRLVKGII